MPQVRDCDYCGSEIPPGTGTMFVRTDGTAIHYCSSKCEKNADLGREPRDVEWIQDEAAEELRRAEEGADTADHEDVDDEGPTSAEEQAGAAGESGDAEAPAGDEAADVAEETGDEADEIEESESDGEATADESGEDETEEA